MATPENNKNNSNISAFGHLLKPGVIDQIDKLRETDAQVNLDLHSDPDQAAQRVYRLLIEGNDVFPSQEFAVPDREIEDLIWDIAKGEKKKKKSAENSLIKRATAGSINDLLDVTNSALVYMSGLRKPELINARIKAPSNKISEAVKNVRNFTVDLFKQISKESTIYILDPNRISTRDKIFYTGGVLELMNKAFAPHELESLPLGFQHFKQLFLTIPENWNQKTGVSISPELSLYEAKMVAETTQKDPTDISQQEFDLVMKAHQNYHRQIGQNSGEIQLKFYKETSEDGLLRSLKLFSKSLDSPDPAVSTRTIMTLTEMHRNLNNIFVEKKFHWLQSIQGSIIKMIDKPEDVDNKLKESIEKFIINLDKQGVLPSFVTALTIDYEDLFSQKKDLEQASYAIKANEEFVDKLKETETENPAIDFLAKAYIEAESISNRIDKQILLELFDPRRNLGFFIDNLNTNWRQLQQISREEIWPSFITRRRAKIWPSEKELDILQFVGKHPASVLGFSGIKFHTRGFNPPAVGAEFTFKNSGQVLRGNLDSAGKLIDLPYDLEEEHPEIHAFLEHIALSSFEELVTIASKRIKVKEEKPTIEIQVDARTGPEQKERPAYAPRLPRKETSYISFSPRFQERSLTSDEIIEEARERERVPRAISQRVVALPYAQQYRYFKNLADQAKASNALDSEIKSLEGQALEYLSLVPNPSEEKLANLPPEFALESVEGGKYLDTWRVAHIRPKPKEGEEMTLPEIFEKRYHAAPIILTEHLSTWFTQPPVTEQSSKA